MPNQGDGVQEKGKTIAAAFEKGVADPNHDMRPAIQALQDAARGNPQEYKQTLAVANQLLDNSANPNVKKFFGNMDLIEGTDSKGLRLQRRDGAQFVISDNGKATQVGTGASMDATRKDAQGNRIEKGTTADGLTKERITSADGSASVEKYTDKQGQHWEIEKHKQADGTLRPTKVTLPDGSTMKFEWNRESGTSGTLYPTRMTELNAGGRVVRDYQMQPLKSVEGRYDTSAWERKAGSEPADKEFRGTLNVDSNGNTNFTFRNPLLIEKINADGNTSKNGVDKNLKRIEEHHRRTR
ncbi:hypothetical protein KF913_13545 [Candidatus Obscuribacterales bacterium]|nr:hypothetical protein [Candidatus Obscuribacterales bacterium]